MITTWEEQKPHCQGCCAELSHGVAAYIIRFPGAREIDSWFVCGDCAKNEKLLYIVQLRAEARYHELRERNNFAWCEYFNQWMKSEPPNHGKKSAPPLHH